MELVRTAKEPRHCVSQSFLLTRPLYVMIAGCHSERIPVVHIVGTPATSAQFGGKLLHHTLGDHKFNAFSEMARQITSAQLDFATLKREGRMPDSEEKSNGGQEYQMGGEDAARELDRILEHCIKEVSPLR